jgi:hypothetical protein
MVSGFFFLITYIAERIGGYLSSEQIVRSRERIVIRPPNKVLDLTRDTKLPSFPPKPPKSLGRRALTSVFFPHGLLQQLIG